MYIQCLFIKEQYLSQYPHSPLSHLCWASCMWLHKRLCSPPPSSSLHWIESSDQTWWAPSWERARPKPWEEGRHGHQPHPTPSHPTSPTHQPWRRLPSPYPAPSDYCWLPPRVGWGEVQETGCQKSTNMFKNIPLEQNWFSLWQDIKSEHSLHRSRFKPRNEGQLKNIGQYHGRPRIWVKFYKVARKHLAQEEFWNFFEQPAWPRAQGELDHLNCACR